MRYAIALWILAGICSTPLAHPQSWSVRLRPSLVEVFYRLNGVNTQYAALHTDSAYFRLIYGPQAGWGTSVVVMPSFWSNGAYYQGVPVTASWRIAGDDFVLDLTGNNHGIIGTVSIRISPPSNGVVSALVTGSTTGTVPLDNRPNEAFKPLMLSSMKVSGALWDAQSAYVDCRNYSIPTGGWLIYPAQTGRVFGLRGGTSTWKANAPTTEIQLWQNMSITGWVTPSSDPNDDNIGMWAGSSTILRNWSYVLMAAAERSTFAIRGTLGLGDYVGDVSEPEFVVEIRPQPGSTFSRTDVLHLDASGGYVLSGVPCGSYSLAIKGDRWLREIVGAVTVAAADASAPAAVLVNGDTNGSNAVDDADITNVILDYDTPGGANGLADLDGSGAVDDADLTIAILSFGQVGDL